MKAISFLGFNPKGYSATTYRLHAGFSQCPRAAQEVIAQTRQILSELREIAKLWNLD